MRSYAVILVVMLSGAVAAAEDIGRDSRGTSAAIDRGVAFLVKDALAWKQEHNCVSCHHASLVIWSLREAKGRGHTIDEPVLAELTKWVAESGEGKTGVPRPESVPQRSTKRPYRSPWRWARIPSRTPSRRLGSN